jgi:hypothetical protein
MAKQFDAYIEGLNPLLRDLSKLGKVASKELRQASKVIAEKHMVTAFKASAINSGRWGDALASGIRAGADRVPKVMIGAQKKTSIRGRASSNMLRYPVETGDKGDNAWKNGVDRAGSFAPFERTNWLAKARTYQKPALQEWGQAVDRVVLKWPVM